MDSTKGPVRTTDGLPSVWGASAAEVARRYGGDDEIPNPDARLLRAVTADAESSAVFRWLCQLMVAPYSYDWLDNWGRRSPRRLTEGVDRLQVGEPFMTIFRLAGFVPGESVTLRLSPRMPRWVLGEQVLSIAELAEKAVPAPS